MLDLANERAEVCRRLAELNFEAVNAEGLLPNGARSWERLQPEIESSDLFVLILGEKYGWIPPTGPGAADGKSVTEMEYDAARSAGLPILVFSRPLRHSTAPATDDERRRDAFRAAVEAWEDGYFRTEFELARDLADKVAQAVVGYITDRLRAFEVEQRRTARVPRHTVKPEHGPETLQLPPGLVDAVADRRVILMLGAGASLQAGMPSADAFVTAMVEQIREDHGDYRAPASGTQFNAVATDFESLLSEERLWEVAQELVDPPYVDGPTTAHRVSARLFDIMLTTNYDTLLERATETEGMDVGVISSEASEAELQRPRQIIKLHGSISDPRGLVLTESDLAGLEMKRPRLWARVQKLLRERPLLVVGSSLRDPSIVRLLESCRPHVQGWAVVYEPNAAEKLRLGRWGLEAIPGDADGVLLALEQEVAERRAGRDRRQAS